MLNFLLLFAVAVTPLSSSLLGSFRGEAVTVALYAANVVVISVSLFLMWLHVNRKRALLHADVGRLRIQRGLWGAGLTALVFLASIVVAQFLPSRRCGCGC